MSSSKWVNQSGHLIKYFAMLHNAAALQDDEELEGGLAAEAIGYYLYLLNICQQEIPKSFALPFEKEIQAEMQRLYDMCLVFNDLNEKKQLLAQEELKKVIENIKQQCDNYGHCYLPIGYMGHNGGHFLGIKIRKMANGEYAFSTINHGDGIQFHLQTSISIKGTRKKYSYQSHEYSIDIHSEEGHKILKYLLQVMFDPNLADMKKSHINAYGSLDIYGLLKLYGKEKILDINDAQANKSVTPQRSGTCPMTNTHAVARDILVSHQADLNTKKRYHFVIKLRSLIDGYDRYRKGECSLVVFEWALNEFSVRLNKYYRNILSEEESIYCAKLQNSMKMFIEDAKAAIMANKTRIAPVPEMQMSVSNFSKPNLASLESHAVNPSISAANNTAAMDDLLNGNIRVDNIASSIKMMLSSQQSLDTIYFFLTNLAPCSGEDKDSYWDKLKTSDIAILIDQFASIADYLKSITNKYITDEQKAKSCVVALVMYDIAAQILPRLDVYKLGNEYTLGLDDIYSQQSIFSNPLDYIKIKNIAHNFAKRAQGKKTIFSNVLNKDEGNTDKTIHYVLYDLCDEKSRKQLLERVKKEHPEKNDTNVTDSDLFKCWLKYNDTNILKLSSLAHHGGLSTATYEPYIDIHGDTKEYNSRWCFTQTPYLLQLLRQSERLPRDRKRDFEQLKDLKSRIDNNEIASDQLEGAKHYLLYLEQKILKKDDTSKLYKLPDRNSLQHLDHFDYAENSVFIPYDRMQEIENQSKNKRSRSYRPFETQLTGSLHPWHEKMNHPWDIKSENLQTYIELNEQFRLLECSPHFQVIKTLYWIKNNSTYLNNMIVRDRLNQLIFHYGKFDLAFSNHPDEVLHSIEAIYSLVTNITKGRSKHWDSDVSIWYLNLIQKLHEYVITSSAEYNISLEKYRYLNIRDILLNQIQQSDQISHKAQFAAILLSDLDMTGIMSIDETCQFLMARLLLSLGADPIPQQHLWIKHRQKIIDRLNGPDGDKIISQLVQVLSKSNIVNAGQLVWDKKTERLINSDKNIYIDLSLGAFCDQQTLDIKKDKTDQVFLHNELLLKGLNLNNDGKLRLFSNGRYLESSDGRWRFEYHLDTSTNAINITNVKQTITIDGHQVVFEIYNKFWLEGERSKNDDYYHYWISSDPEKLILVDSILSDKKYLHSADPSTFNILLHLEADGEYTTTDQVLLDVGKPTTKLEISWAERFVKVIKLDQLHCIASYNVEHKTLQMQSIQMLDLGIRFDINIHAKLMCQEYPGYYLSQKVSLPEISGFPNVLILENDIADLKVIIPAYILNNERGNNTFHLDNIVKIGNYCFDDQHYFTYTLNKNRELVSDSLVGNMYLVLLLRSLGDFKGAITVLDKCRTHEIIDPRVIFIIYQIINRPILSPLGAAFDLKLIAYLNEHGGKWYKQKTLNTKIPGISPEMKFRFDEHHKKINDLYVNSYSHFKNEISIHPSYLRLTAHEKEFVGLVEQLSTNAEPIVQDEKLESVGKYPIEFINQGFNHDLMPSQKDMEDYIGIDCNAMRTNYHSSKPFDSLNYLLYQFKNLMFDAVSPNADAMDFKRELFFILQHQESKSALYRPDEKRVTAFHGLISLLLFIQANRDKFKHFSASVIQSVNLYELVNSAIQIMKDNKEAFVDQVHPLIDFKVNPYQLKIDQPFAYDIEREKLYFDITPIASEFVRPFEPLFKKYIRRKDVPVSSEPFSLAEDEFSTLLEKNLYNRYKYGHENNLKLTQPEYQANNDCSLHDLVSELTDQIKKDKNTLKLLTDRVLKMANKTPINDENATIEQKAKAYHLMQQYASHQKHPLELGDVFVALLQRNPNLLSEQNPFLTQEDIKSIFTTLSELACTQSRISQSNRILNIVNDKNELRVFEIQEYSALLDQTRTYAISDYPEFLVYEYAAGVMLRPDQVATLMQLIEYISKGKGEDEIRHALLQFAAGGGKTSVLIPILAQRFANIGLLPVIINTSELYDIGLDQLPKSLSSSFKQQLEVIECELDYPWSTLELMKLRDDLNRWVNDKDHLRCVLLKSVTWHSLNIARKSAYLEGDIQRAKAAEAVLAFFKNRTIKLEDESHIVSDPMLQSIKTEGKQVAIPKHLLKLLQRFYDYIMGKEKTFASIANLAGIVNNRKTPILPKDLVELQLQIAHAIANDNAMSGVEKHELIAYLTKNDKERPAWLHNLHSGSADQSDLADRIILARSFIQVHLPHILSLQQHKDFGTSIHVGDLTAAPKHEGNDVHSHFGDYALLASLTIQMYEVNGLTPVQLTMLLERVITDSEKERVWNTNYNVPTIAEEWLRSVMSNFNSYEDLTHDVIDKIAHDPNLQKHPIFVKAFLDDYALPQIKVPTTRLTSTAAEMQAGFNHSIMVSATPGLPEVYPAYIGAEQNNIFMDESFEARVIDTLLQHNKKHIILDMSVSTPSEFFSQFPMEDLQTITTLIDRGSLLTDFNVKEIITAYFKIEKSKRASTSAAFFVAANDGRQKMHLKTQSPHVSEVEIDGAALISALKKQQIDPEEFMLFLFLDLSKTTGTDILRPYQDKAALTVGKGQTVTETIQAAMRQRRLLKKDAQTITWVLFKSLYAQINKDNPSKFDPRSIMPWLIKNEAEKIEAKLKMRAYQGIDQAISEVVWAKVSTAPASYHKYKNFLESTQSVSPYDTYEVESTKEKPDTVLREYCQRILTSVDLDYDSLPKSTRARIEKIIRETNSLIETLDNPPKSQIGVEVEQAIQQDVQEETKTQTQQRVKTRLDEFSEFSLALEAYSQKADNISSIFDNHPNYKPLVLPNCEAVTLPKLLISAKHFCVTEHALNEKASLTEMKPINHLLIKIMPDNKYEYLACTSAGVEFYTKQFKEMHFNEKYPAYAIVSNNGDILSRSNNLSLSNLEEIVSTDTCQSMLAYINFLNGNIFKPHILAKLLREHNITTYDQYLKIVDAIQNIHVSQQPISLLNNQQLNSFCGWFGKSVPIKSAEVKSSQKQDIGLGTFVPYPKVSDNMVKGDTITDYQPMTALDNDAVGKPISSLAILPKQTKAEINSL